MRTSLMHHMIVGDPLQTLLAESSREGDIAFLIVMDKNGKVLSETEDAPVISFIGTDKTQILDTNIPVTSIGKKKGIFTISKRLNLQTHSSAFPGLMGHSRRPAANAEKVTSGIISIGLLTKEFDAARKQDVQHAIFMGAILFLVGSAGLYVLFLYQSIRVTKSTLANMKLYTDNVLESIPVGLVTLDDNDRVVSSNKMTEEILGSSLEDLRGASINEAFPECQIKPSDICNTILDYSTECCTEDGRKVPLEIGGSTLKNDTGEDIGTVLVIRDMSLIREMEQQLERSRRMAALGKMATGIAHEIRNPLGTLRGFAHYFGSQEGATEESQGYAELMKSEVDRLNRNISGLLQFARPREPNIIDINLDELISKTVTLMESDFSKQTLNFHWQCNTGITLEADPDLILQVLLNLLKNSILATPSGGEVSLGATETEQWIRISVTDNGMGMSEQECEKMFDPFFTTRKTGTGLGLAVSHQLIEQHNGTFEVKTDLDVGTTVTIILPKIKRTP